LPRKEVVSAIILSFEFELAAEIGADKIIIPAKNNTKKAVILLLIIFNCHLRPLLFIIFQQQQIGIRIEKKLGH
jgi:hypothetical protein